MSNSGASHIETLKIDQQKLSSNSNGYNFSLGCLIHVHHISRPSKLTTEVLEIFKRSLLLTRRSDSNASHIETLAIEQRKLSSNSNGHNLSLEGRIQAHNISRQLKFNNGSSCEIQLGLTFNSEARFRRIRSEEHTSELQSLV